MFETTSMNLFTNSVLGGVLTFVSFVLSLGLGILVVGWLYSKVSIDKLGAWLLSLWGALGGGRAGLPYAVAFLWAA